MEVAYTPKSFPDISPYPPVGEDDNEDHDEFINTEANVDDMADLARVATYNDDSPSRFSTPESPSPHLDLGPVAALNVDPTNVPPIRDPTPVLLNDDLNTTSNEPENENENENAANIPSSKTRSKPIAKPDRFVTKNADGRYECRWRGCNEETRTFARRCEWSKHMDKHERPYVCTVRGCEKVQGFTYSGGLLRHEREVHGKHGGPKKAFNCPHASCKRNTGKGFSRMENLQEHLRRCHRAPSAQNSDPGAVTVGAPQQVRDEDSNSDVASAAFAVLNGMSPPDTTNLSEVGGGGADAGHKRKRSHDDEAGQPGRERALREENERLRNEVDELRRQLQEQMWSANEMRTQLRAMQATISQTLSLPQPPP